MFLCNTFYNLIFEIFLFQVRSGTNFAALKNSMCCLLLLLPFISLRHAQPAVLHSHFSEKYKPTNQIRSQVRMNNAVFNNPSTTNTAHIRQTSMYKLIGNTALHIVVHIPQFVRVGILLTWRMKLSRVIQVVQVQNGGSFKPHGIPFSQSNYF